MMKMMKGQIEIRLHAHTRSARGWGLHNYTVPCHPCMDLCGLEPTHQELRITLELLLPSVWPWLPGAAGLLPSPWCHFEFLLTPLMMLISGFLSLLFLNWLLNLHCNRTVERRRKHKEKLNGLRAESNLGLMPHGRLLNPVISYTGSEKPYGMFKIPQNSGVRTRISAYQKKNIWWIKNTQQWRYRLKLYSTVYFQCCHLGLLTRYVGVVQLSEWKIWVEVVFHKEFLTSHLFMNTLLFIIYWI